MKKRSIMLLLLLAAVLTLILLVCTGNNPKVTEYEISRTEIPVEFDGYRIVQISDLHNATFGEDNEGLLEMIRNASPDIIILTGDLVDSRRTDIRTALDFAERVAEIAPTYYVSGNHESRIAAYPMLVTGLEEAGIIVLENEAITLARDGAQICLAGLMDPAFETQYLVGDEAAVMAKHISELTGKGYTILLSHRPELFDVYAAAGANLVFSGHAHGGQFRLPWIGGLYAPGQGFLPEYDAGIFTEGETTMVVSRGLGNSVRVPRILNPPEIVVVTLNCNG